LKSPIDESHLEHPVKSKRQRGMIRLPFVNRFLLICDREQGKSFRKQQSRPEPIQQFTLGFSGLLRAGSVRYLAAGIRPIQL